MKLFTRTLIILLLMIIGSWLNGQLIQYNATTGQLGTLTYIAMYVAYLLIGITVGTVANPRFTKAKNKWVYAVPIIIFALIGAQWFFLPLYNVATLPFGIGNYLMQFSYLSWAIVGFFLSIASR